MLNKANEIKNQMLNNDKYYGFQITYLNENSGNIETAYSWDRSCELKDEIKQLKLQLEKQTLSNVLDKKVALGTKQDINEILNTVGYTNKIIYSI